MPLHAESANTRLFFIRTIFRNCKRCFYILIKGKLSKRRYLGVEQWRNSKGVTTKVSNYDSIANL